MPDAPVIISLPTTDRQVAFRFFGDGLGFDVPGEPADDGVPEPLTVVLGEGIHLMLVPTGGFHWVIGGNEVASAGISECLLGISARGAIEVDRLLERAIHAGARVVTEPAQQPWGYSGTFADPDGHLWMVTAATELEADPIT